MSTTPRIAAAVAELTDYAKELQSAGFKIYWPKQTPHRAPATYFTYSQMVDGRECFGYVQLDYFGGYSHSMPIKPSTKFGNSMSVDGVDNELTVDTARAIAQPSNRNRIVGLQRNHKEARALGIYDRWAALPAWTVYDDENNTIGRVYASNRLDAQDKAQELGGFRIESDK